MKRVMGYGVVLGAISLFLVAPVQATDKLIVAHIQPVRYIFVDDNEIIQSIESNTDENIPPLVYRNKLPVAVTPNIRHQYNQILREHPLKGRYGRVYTRANTNQDVFVQLFQSLKSISVIPFVY